MPYYKDPDSKQKPMAVTHWSARVPRLVLRVDLLSLTLLEGREEDGNTQGKLLNLTGGFLKSTTLRSRIVPCFSTQARRIIKNLCVPNWQPRSGDWVALSEDPAPSASIVTS